ncbi:hypothetical protein E4T48_02692 [Aureobasidium sp. EXF-10727]|nr:hypothetical protein E4T48_02692 [Aureobasidium sp. EXF-10727]
MPSWQVNLVSPGGKSIDTHNQDVYSDSHATIFIDGDTADANTWRFVPYDEKTQPRRDWISQFIFVGGALQFSSDVVDTYVSTPRPVHDLVCRTRLPFNADNKQFSILLRHGDTVEFDATDARVEVMFDSESNSEDLHVQVESSGPGTFGRKIKKEADTDDDDETDDDAVHPVRDVRRGTSAEESQHLFSTSREHLSPTPRPATRESQVVKETPNRRRIRSQHESAIPESLPMAETDSEHPQPDHIADLTNGSMTILPDVHTSELLDTSPSEALHFRVPTQPTPSPFDQSFGVDKLISNLNEDNPPSQVPPSSVPPKKRTETGPVVIPTQLHEDLSTVEPTEANSLESRTAPPAVESATPALEGVASPVDIINDGITGDERGRDVSTDENTTAIEPNSIASSVRQTPSVVSAGNKRKKVSDSNSVALSTKRARIAEAETTTPTSTASRRSSSRAKGLETPSGSASTRSSARRKSLDEELPSGSPLMTGRRYSGDPPVVLYSNTKIIDRAQTMKNLKKQGASKTEDIKSANFLCVGPGELLKTPKLLHSLTLNKTIVTDDWVSQSVAAGFLLDTAEFLPEELQATKHLDRTKIFTDQIIYVTPTQRLAYKKGWDDVMAIIRQAGGTNPLTGPLSKLDTSTISLYIGADKDDDVAAELQEKGETVYKKDILGASIVHGELILDESLELPPVEVESKAEPKSAKKSGRKKKT